MKKRISALFHYYFILPIIEQFPLFIFSFLLTTIDTAKLLHTCILEPLASNNYYNWLTVCRFFSISVICSFILSFIVYVSKKRWVKIMMYTIPLSLFTVNQFLKNNFGHALDPAYVIIMGETNNKETTEFLHYFLFSKTNIKFIVFLSILVLLIIFVERFRTQIFLFIKKSRLQYIIGTIFLSFLLYGTYSLVYLSGLFQCRSLKDLDIWSAQYNEFYYDYYTRMLYSLYAPIPASYEINKNIEITTAAYQKTRYKNNNDSLNLIFVIGESYIKSHASIYGYRLNTTPNLKHEVENGNLFVFTNVITPYNTTSMSVKNIMSCNNFSGGEQWQDFPYFPAIFKSCGYNVYYWDNQNKVGQHSDFTLNSFLSNDVIRSLSYTIWNDSIYQYDGALIDDFFNKNRTTSDNNLIILHLWGQHLDAKERYPHCNEFNHFTSDSINWRKEKWITSTIKQEIAEYDNAVLYNDDVMKKIINHYRNTNAVIVYLSDHGEEIYDYRNSKGRKNIPMNRMLLKYQYEIPFVIWCSDTYKKKHPKLISLFQSALNTPMTSDNVCNLLFRIASLKTPYYRKKYDILSSNYICYKRIVADKIDYDKIMKRNNF